MSGTIVESKPVVESSSDTKVSIVQNDSVDLSKSQMAGYNPTAQKLITATASSHLNAPLNDSQNFKNVDPRPNELGVQAHDLQKQALDLAKGIEGYLERNGASRQQMEFLTNKLTNFGNDLLEFVKAAQNSTPKMSAIFDNQIMERLGKANLSIVESSIDTAQKTYRAIEELRLVANNPQQVSATNLTKRDEVVSQALRNANVELDLFSAKIDVLAKSALGTAQEAAPVERPKLN